MNEIFQHESHSILMGCVCVCYRVIHVAVYRASSGRMQAPRRKHDKTDSGFVLLVFHILKRAVDVGVKCGTFLSKSFLWVHDCLRARRPVLIPRQTYVCVCVFVCKLHFYIGCFWEKQLKTFNLHNTHLFGIN